MLCKRGWGRVMSVDVGMLELLEVLVAKACAHKHLGTQDGGVLRAKPNPGSKLLNTQPELWIFSATPHTRNGGLSR